MGEGATRISRADLDGMKPGFGAYFDRWLELQEKAWRDAGEDVSLEAVDAVLMALAFAHGPLAGSDITAIAAHLPGAPHTLVPRRLLMPLRRFVVGNGRERGYVLSHPKIGEHLQQERFGEAKATVKKAFLAWGQEMVAHANQNPVDAVNTPRYLIQFYRRHLEESNASLVEFFPLIEDGWRRAWEAYEGSQEGFAADVRGAWVIARNKGPLAELGIQLRCALVLASVRSLGHNVPKGLIVAAVAEKLLSVRQARHLARFMRSRTDYVDTLGSLAGELELDPMVKTEFLNEALAAAKAIEATSARVHALRGLVGYLSGIQLDEVLAAVEGIGDGAARAIVLRALAERADAGQAVRILTAARKIDDVLAQAQLLRALAGVLSRDQSGRAMLAALAVANAIDAPPARAFALSGIADHLSGEQRDVALGQALTAAQAIPDASTQALALTDIADRAAGKLRDEAKHQALAAMKAIGDVAARTLVLNRLAPHLSSRERQLTVSEALADAASIKSTAFERAHVLRAVAGLLNESQVDQAMLIIGGMEEELREGPCSVRLGAA